VELLIGAKKSSLKTSFKDLASIPKASSLRLPKGTISNIIHSPLIDFDFI
jgi:hypothetical protein